MSVLEVEHLSVSFTRYTGGLQQQKVEVIHDLQLRIDEGQIVAVVGSSGSGKSLLAHAIMGILPGNAVMTGSMRYKGEPLNAARQAALRGHEISLVPQSVNYLDPLMSVGAQVRASVKHKDPLTEQRKVFERYQLAQGVERQYPFQLSGGMARRVLLSTATISGARLIVADEPTPGLHHEAAQETLRQLRELADEGCSILMITHDIESALHIADKVAVFYAGTIVEVALTADFAGDGQRLRHPYSQALWQALPQNEFKPIPGVQPLPGELPAGCLFAPRCAVAAADCCDKRPDMRELRGGTVRCFHAS
ncbi:ABC transporter ATP-binding protein [Paenibacillus eucommiae]|uniref:Nickel import system ATP-binding protein NikD n=1 Tax=Paenibacillus eucommiae TaxID=1355755 RepID=A0ABS4JCR7_9BACL|nr:ABC transporter ATP-binding protein [Paenibacillus eucommiae]MBP1996866.1 peptide/nickel transport system ATP-binding protein [Paenibacillus eucommiae]